MPNKSKKAKRSGARRSNVRNVSAPTRSMKMEEMSEGTEMVREKAQEALEMAQKKFMMAEKKIERYIQTHPAQALLIAAGIGAAIGASMMSSKDKAKKK